jgi:hypothetical protein
MSVYSTECPSSKSLPLKILRGKLLKAKGLAWSRCHSPALRDRSYCYFHQNLHTTVLASRNKKRDDDTIEFASLEDAKGIQIALTQVLDALTKCRIDSRQGGLLIYGLNLATQIAKRCAEFDPSKTVSNVCHDSDGSLIAAEELPVAGS